MATVPPIRQTIKFEGLEEIKQKLSDLGGAGERAFEQLRAASAPAVQSMERLESSIQNVQRSMASVATTGRNFTASVSAAGGAFNNFEAAVGRTVRSLRNYALALTAAATGVGLFIRSGIQAGDAIEEQAQALGLSTQRFQELGFAAAEAGVKSTQFSSGIKFFSQQLEKDAIASDQALLKFLDARKFDDFGGRIKQVGNQTSATFAAVEEGVRALQARIAAAGGQVPPFADLRRELLALATGTAKTRAEFEELTGRALPASKDGLDDFRSGAIASKNALAQLGIDVKRSADGTIDLNANLDQIADKFASTPDGVRKTAQAMALFGKAAGPALIPFLNQGSAGIEGFLAKARELGVFLSEDQIKASSAAARSFDVLARAATNVKNSIGSAFAPLAGTIAGGLTEFISTNQAAINAFANDLNTKATPYIQAFFDMLAGRENVTEAGEKIDQLRQRFVTFGATLRSIGAVIGNAFTLVISVLDQVAAAIKAVFGTSLSGAELGVILIITKMVGGFALLLGSMRLVGAAFTVLNNGLKLLVASGGFVVNALRLLGVALLGLVGLAGWPAVLAIALGGLLLSLGPVREAMTAILELFTRFFGMDVTAGNNIITAIGLIITALIALRARAIAARLALMAMWLATNPVGAAVLAAAAIAGVITALIESGKEAEDAGKAAEKAADASSDGLARIGSNAKTATAAVSGVKDGVINVQQALEAQKKGTDDWGGRISAVAKKAQADVKDLNQTIETTSDPERPPSIVVYPKSQQQSDASGLDAVAGKVAKLFSMSAQASEGSAGFARGFEEATPILNSFAERFQGVPTFADRFNQHLKGTVGNLTDAVKFGEQWQDSLKSVAQILDGIDFASPTNPVQFDVIGKDQPKNLQAFKDSLVDTGLKAGEAYKIMKDGSVVVSQATQDLLNAGKNLGQSFVGAGQKVGPAFTEMKALSNNAFTEMQAGPKKLADSVKGAATAIQGSLEGTFDSLDPSLLQPIDRAVDSLQTNLAGLPLTVGQAFTTAGPPIDAFKAKFVGLPTTTDAFKAKLNELPPVVSQAFTTPAIDAFKNQFAGLPSTTEQFKAALSTLAPVVDQSLGAAAQDATELKAPVDQAAVSATNLGTSFTTGLTGVDAIIGGISDSIGGLIEQITAAIAKMQELGAAQSESGAGGFDEAGFEGFARGGHVRGPGTSTSDSILARLSRGEFVQREKAVRYYGTDFMAALNALRIPKDMFRGFNAGGLVDGLNQSLSALMIPRFNVGGLADMAPAVASSSGRSLTLVLDGQRFAGLRGPDDTIARLEKHAIAQQTGSTGRKPSWVR